VRYEEFAKATPAHKEATQGSARDRERAMMLRPLAIKAQKHVRL
jgi:hypothetical protein